MDRIRRAIAGGIAGTAAMSAVFVFAEVEMRFNLGVTAALARYVRLPGRPFVGALVFVGVGVVAWPLLYVAVEPYFRALPGGDDPAVRGVAFAVVLWVVFLLLGTGPIRGVLLLLYLTFTLIGHLVYGFALGALYERLDEESDPAGAAERSGI